MLKSNLYFYKPSFISKRIVISLLCISIVAPSFLWAAPYGGQVTSGIAIINQSGSVTNINQSTNKATINWQGFSISPTETVNFNQPSALSMTLNRVIGNEKSIISGALNANGRVYIINANGIVFTKGASVNVGGLVASTLNITDDDFNKVRTGHQHGHHQGHG
jgi:filamentous hemagglutinin family protein